MRALSPTESRIIRHLVAGAEAPEIDGVVDWDRLLAGASRHRLVPLLFTGLARTSIVVPGCVRERLEKGFQVEVARAVVRLHHLESLERTAERTKRPLCLLKGAAFSRWLYPNPALRPMADIDVLVREGELEPWVSELVSLGYRLQTASDHATCFRHAESGVDIELHRALTSSNDFLGVDMNALWERSVPISPFIHSLTPEDHLLHLCLHASFQHGFRQAAVNAHDTRLLVAQPEFDAERFLASARTEKLTRWIYAGLALSETTFPDAGLRSLAAELSVGVPLRLRRKLARLDPASLMSPDRATFAGPPFRRLFWAGDISTSLSLLIDVSRPRGNGARGSASAWGARAGKLLWNHCVKVIPLVLMKHAQTFPRQTPASLGEVRDV